MAKILLDHTQTTRKECHTQAQPIGHAEKLFICNWLTNLISYSTEVTQNQKHEDHILQAFGKFYR